ncbi:hypothetical protein BASA50_006132 [Batrachochytrium salamandrivorans]|uniref:RxLR effector protein n=1 Tax=Batrachochytrium salamandrivorans TaxID=1357716 RepID=A0ABQ8FAR2_9FUNG|nr:hypothetical protein BASA50_006132 [Batrachochytrium salamandrivorans]
MQFFHLFSFVVVASYAAALPQPAELSEKYSNNVDTNLASGLEARSYQPVLNSYKDNVSTENLASTIDKTKNDVPAFYKDGEEAGQKISGRAGDMMAKYLRKSIYVLFALKRWEYVSVPIILKKIEYGLDEDKYSKVGPELAETREGLNLQAQAGWKAISDDISNIIESHGSVIEAVQRIHKSVEHTLLRRTYFIWDLKNTLDTFESGKTLRGYLTGIDRSTGDFFLEQINLHKEIMKELRAAPSQ